MKIFIDMDDTLFAFKQRAVEMGVPDWSGTWYTMPRENWTQEQCEIQDATTALMKNPEFWETIPLMPGALELVAAAATRYPTYLLTALPSALDRTYWPMIEHRKIMSAYAKLHFPVSRVICCERKDKVRHAVNRASYMATIDVLGGKSLVDNEKPNILIDDAEQNCKEWREHHGFAHHFTDMSTAIKFVKGIHCV